MKGRLFVTVLVLTLWLPVNLLHAQDSLPSCKVSVKSLVGVYKGECKKGLAYGPGEAKGYDRYVGLFKYGFPDGKGTWYYRDTAWYTGNFLEGIKEGKGEMHYLRNGKPDSLIKGYWSADEFRGNRYVTYSFDGATKFDRSEFIPTPESGNSITFEVSTTSGSPDGTQRNFNGSSGYVLTITNVLLTNGGFIKKVSDFVTANKFSVTYELSKFPANLIVDLSNGQSFNLELYKSARWTARLYVNK